MSPNTGRTKFMSPVTSIECLQVFSRHTQRKKEWSCKQWSLRKLTWEEGYHSPSHLDIRNSSGTWKGWLSTRGSTEGPRGVDKGGHLCTGDRITWWLYIEGPTSMCCRVKFNVQIFSSSSISQHYKNPQELPRETLKKKTQYKWFKATPVLIVDWSRIERSFLVAHEKPDVQIAMQILKA